MRQSKICVEQTFQEAKGETGIAHYEVRGWDGWHHHMTLSLLALWFLLRERAQLENKSPAVTVQQVRRAFSELLRERLPGPAEIARAPGASRRTNVGR